MSIWIPHAYPREAPLVYVTPTENMTVRPGQHVDPQGQVYHPYLVGWSTFWDVCCLHYGNRKSFANSLVLRNPQSWTFSRSCATSLPRSLPSWPASKRNHLHHHNILLLHPLYLRSRRTSPLDRSVWPSQLHL